MFLVLISWHNTHQFQLILQIHGNELTLRTWLSVMTASLSFSYKRY